MTDILVVEGERRVREAIASRLSELGYDVSEASDGQEAIDLISRMHFDVVITAVLMENVDGIQLLSWLENQAVRPRTIAMSAGHENIPREMALVLAKTHAHAAIEKPIDETLLLDLVEQQIKEIGKERKQA